MRLSDKQIAEFQALYKKHFGKDISKDEALEKGLRLCRLLEIVSRAIAYEQNQSARNT